MGYATIDVSIREPHDDPDAQAASTAAARATENMLRRQSNPHEEAVAVKRMLDSGLTPDGAAQALGWPKVRITVRIKLLELPEVAQRMIGTGALPTAAVDLLRIIGAVSTEVLDTFISYLADASSEASRFMSEPAFVLADALRGSDTFAAHLDSVDGREIEVLKLGKRAQYEEIVELEKKVDRYAYGTPPVPFSDDDVDQARAAGVLSELPGRQPAPLIVDRALFRDLAKQAIKRHAQTLTPSRRPARRAACHGATSGVRRAGRSGQGGQA